MARKSYSEHSFYCLNCGNKGIPLLRPQGFKREEFHRKKLYCPTCKFEVNHIECKTYDEVLTFKENFERGAYKDEAEASVCYVRS